MATPRRAPCGACSSRSSGSAAWTTSKPCRPPDSGRPCPRASSRPGTGYRDWLIEELERRGGNVDLVGHDWGAGHVYAVLAERPDLLRSWAADCAGLLHGDYVWHPMAQTWQTPEAGEQAVAAMVGMPLEQRAATWVSLGLPKDVAEVIAAEQNEEMGRCILALYRSARQPAMAELGERLRSRENKPGLVIVASEDPYTGTPEMCGAVAADLGAGTLTLEGLGHWWMFEGAARAAHGLLEHWRGTVST